MRFIEFTGDVGSAASVLIWLWIKMKKALMLVVQRLHTTESQILLPSHTDGQMIAGLCVPY
jgi:hypothetical protein